MIDAELKILVGQNVARYRMQAGLTQAQLSEMVGVSSAFISLVERGQKMMRLSTLRAMSGALRVSSDALLFPENPETNLDNILYILSQQPRQSLSKIEKLVRFYAEELDPPEAAPPAPLR